MVALAAGCSGHHGDGATGTQTNPGATGSQLEGVTFFPSDNPFHQDVSQSPVDPRSATLLTGCGGKTHLHADFGTVYEGKPNGFAFNVVGASQPKVAVTFEYADESDPGPYPIPPDAGIEGGDDHHVLVVDRDAKKLYEVESAERVGDGWKGASGAVFDLTSNAQRPAGWTSADAAGLPILPALVRYDEVVTKKAIDHALRFTCDKTRKGYVAPARHFASSNTSTDVPPMGMRVRLRAGFDASALSPEAQVIAAALKKYGMFLADNGSAFYVQGVHDARWSDDALADVAKIAATDLEVVQLGPVVTTSD